LNFMLFLLASKTIDPHPRIDAIFSLRPTSLPMNIANTQLQPVREAPAVSPLVPRPKDAVNSVSEPAVNVRSIQGNIVAGFKKDLFKLIRTQTCGEPDGSGDSNWRGLFFPRRSAL
jgi:hypothetical protein